MISGQRVLTLLVREWEQPCVSPGYFFCRACGQVWPRVDLTLSSHEAKHGADLAWLPLQFWKQTEHLHPYMAFYPLVQPRDEIRMDNLEALQAPGTARLAALPRGTLRAAWFVTKHHAALARAGVRVKLYKSRGGVNAYFLMGREEWFFLREMTESGMPLAHIERVYKQMAAHPEVTL